MVKGAKINIPSEHPKGQLPVVIAGDLTSGKPGIIVLQEWWGLNEQIQDEAAQLGKMCDYATIVPDLYRGQLATNNEAAGHLMNNLDWPGAVKDIRACAQYLKSQGCKKVGVTGFCMGGALSLAGAGLVKEIDAAAPFYGIPSPDLVDVSKIKIPLQCHFGDQDEMEGFTDPKAQAGLRKKLEEGKVRHEFFSYKGCKHAFTNSTGPNFNEAAFKESFQRLSKFFTTSLK